ncbi:MAG: GDYXXLXY domain-containing protein [Leptospirales bacterium]|nr:GDYXXLXY domain-containing protein [Leptospirales bacterium]
MNRKLFIVVVVLQSVLLLTMIAKQEILLRTGKKIALKCRALDPRSLFSGDYVILNYDISEIDLNVYIPDNKENEQAWQDFSKGDDVFVTLKKNAADDFFSVSGVSKSYSEHREDDTVVLCGKVESYSPSKKLHVKYGIENYFVPQEEGRRIEENMNDIHAEVSVKGKRCALSKLFHLGVEIKFY